MNIVFAICVYLIVLVVIFAIMYLAGRVKAWSALAFSVLVALLSLVFVYSPPLLITSDSGWMATASYLLILAVSVFILIIYILSMAIDDCNRR